VVDLCLLTECMLGLCCCDGVSYFRIGKLQFSIFMPGSSNYNA
jgi:hypothetical protein